MVGSASIVLAIKEASRRANSGGFREERPQKSRIIPGIDAIAPIQDQPFVRLALAITASTQRSSSGLTRTISKPNRRDSSHTPSDSSTRRSIPNAAGNFEQFWWLFPHFETVLWCRYWLMTPAMRTAVEREQGPDVERAAERCRVDPDFPALPGESLHQGDRALANLLMTEEPGEEASVFHREGEFARDERVVQVEGDSLASPPSVYGSHPITGREKRSPPNQITRRSLSLRRSLTGV